MSRDYRDQQRTSAGGQFPTAVVLGCIDSRAPAEIILDAGIGDTFNARIAGNVVNDDLLGSLEFACAVAGAKVLLVLGHTACGAIKGAIDDVEMGNLTGLLARIKPAITATTFAGEKTSKNAAYVDAVALTNISLGLDNVRRRSPILADLEKKSTIRIVGAMYRPGHGHGRVPGLSSAASVVIAPEPAHAAARRTPECPASGARSRRELERGRSRRV